MSEERQGARRLTVEQVREELLANEEFVSQMLARRNPPKVSHWYESPGLIAVLSALVTSLLAFALGGFEKRDEQRLESRKTRLINIQSTVGQLSTLVSGLLLSAEDRAQIAKGAYSDLALSQLDPIVDTTNAMDLRWRLGRQQMELFLRFHFTDDSRINRAWASTRGLLQEYSNCAERAFYSYWKDTTKKAPPTVCSAQRDSSMAALDVLNGELIRGYRTLEQF